MPIAVFGTPKVCLALAGGIASAHLTSSSLVRARLSAQDLRYAATALRIEASITEHRADQPEYGSTRSLFRAASSFKRDLAARLERVAEMVAAREGSTRPVGSSTAERE